MICWYRYRYRYIYSYRWYRFDVGVDGDGDMKDIHIFFFVFSEYTWIHGSVHFINFGEFSFYKLQIFLLFLFSCSYLITHILQVSKLSYISKIFYYVFCICFSSSSFSFGKCIDISIKLTYSFFGHISANVWVHQTPVWVHCFISVTVSLISSIFL